MKFTKMSTTSAAGAAILLALITAAPASAASSDDSFDEIAAANQAAVSEIDLSRWGDAANLTAEFGFQGPSTAKMPPGG